MPTKRVPPSPEKGKTKYDYSLLPELVCSVCENSDLALEDYTPHGRKTVGYRLPLICLDCEKHRVRERRRLNKQDARTRNPEKVRKSYREWQLKSTYNLSLDAYESLLLSQNSGCAVCYTTDPGAKAFHVDHDHTCCPGNKSCGKCVRGLLCSKCNLMIGLSKDNSEILRAAALYIEGEHG